MFWSRKALHLFLLTNLNDEIYFAIEGTSLKFSGSNEVEFISILDIIWILTLWQQNVNKDEPQLIWIFSVELINVLNLNYFIILVYSRCDSKTRQKNELRKELSLVSFWSVPWMFYAILSLDDSYSSHVFLFCA